MAKASAEATKIIWKGMVVMAKAMAKETGALQEGDGRGGDHFRLNVHDIEYDPLKLRTLHSRTTLALIGQERTRTYAKRSQWRPSTREDLFLVGRNENGVAFAHAVSSRNAISTVRAALQWVWDVDDIEDVVDRHGDVGVIRTSAVPKKTTTGTIKVLDSHAFTGEHCVRGRIVYARRGVLTHTKGQHPDVKIGDEWMKLVPARRSVRRTATGTKD